MNDTPKMVHCSTISGIIKSKEGDFVMSVSRWINNLNNINEKNIVGPCPYCGSKRTDYNATIVVEGTDKGYMVIWCNDCKKSLRLSCIVNATYDQGKKVPDDLVI